ncbi:MAG: ClpXP protease specificity-enhancing factor [Pseudomonadota bacterium]|nr:ClpXP protease specificity-enhancing factor [Pseudomonadota bacterium]
MTEFQMTSNRPYLLRAVYEWISDNGLTPYLLVDARQSGVRVPTHAIKDGQIVLNVAMRAVAELELGNDTVRFSARFNGVSQQVNVPLQAVLAVYAQENGQGMMFPPEAQASAPAPTSSENSPEPDKPQRKGPQLRVVK